MSHIATSMDILGITSVAEIGNMTMANLTGLTSQDVETLVESLVVPESDANTIIYYIISETVDSSNTLFPDDNPNTYNPAFDDNYVMDGGVRVRLTREALASVL